VDFAGRSVVLTGVGREGQVGEAVAAAFAEKGARVFLVDRQEAEARARAEALVAAGKRAAGLGADLTNEESVAALAERVRDATGGRVHALVHLAGGFASSGPVSESGLEVWQSQFAINATTAYLAARAFLPHLRQSKGSLVFFASASVLPGSHTKGLSAYAVAKNAVVSLMKTIAEEEGSKGVRANAVAPIAIRTAANLASMGADTPYVSREDVAKVVLWLCSEEARVVSGQVIPIR
jgi:NAD(P)-dependent dehydrogenase (short-subunit alcohol dehydrogenase family)